MPMTNTNTTAEKPAFKVLGVNDDSDFCECCGKQGLKKVVWIEETVTGKLSHFGVICAANPAKAFGLGKEIKAAESNWKNKQDSAWRIAHNQYRKAGGKYASNGIPLHDGGGFVPVEADRVKKLYAEAMAELRAQK